MDQSFRWYDDDIDESDNDDDDNDDDDIDDDGDDMSVMCIYVILSSQVFIV